VGDGLVALLPYLQATPLAIVVAVLLRLWNRAVRDVREERADHERTQQLLDAERERRRHVEDEVAAVKREVAATRSEIAGLRRQLGEAP
jgi:septal ring factor EnvC (AmiA/AmiB activator)